MKLAMEKTPIDAEVSFLMFMLRWVRWYSTVKVYDSVSGQSLEQSKDIIMQTVAIDTHAGSSIRGSLEAPERYRTQVVM